MQTRRVAIALSVVLALAACSDSDDDAATTAPAAATNAPPTSAQSTTTGATTAPAVSDAELAQSALITVDDMPAGWTEAPSDDDDEQDAANVQRISDCSGLDADLIGDGVLGDTKAKSPEFGSPDQLASVKQTLGFAHDEATAIVAIAAIGDDALGPCYEQAMRTTFEEAAVTTDPTRTLAGGMTLTDITMERIDPPVTVDADDAVWYAAKATLDFQGQPIDIYLDLLFTRDGRALSQIEFDGTTARFPEDLFEPTITAAQEKIGAIESV